MAKIINPNIDMQPFANTATKRSIFGGAVGDTSDLLLTNLNADFTLGWETLPVGENPYIQWFNGLGYTLSSQLSLLFQEGVREWTLLQEFYIDNITKGSDGNLYKSVIDNNIGNDPISDNTNWVIAVAGGVALNTNITVTVGAGGDYSTINGAVDYLTNKYHPVFLSSGNVTATINLLTGFIMAEQVFMAGVDLSWISLISADAEVVIDRSALIASGDATGFFPAFEISHGTSIVINALFNMDATGTATDRTGILAYDCSTATVTAGNGFKSAGGYGIVAANGSTVNADSSKASGAGAYGIHANNSSIINANDADASGVVTFGMIADNGSIINASGANVSSSVGFGMIAGNGSTINAANVNASGAGIYGLYADNGSTINASDADASGAGTYGIYSSDGSTINANNVDASGAGTYGIYAVSGSTIGAGGADASGAGTYGIAVVNGSTIDASSSTGTTNISLNTLVASGIIFK